LASAAFSRAIPAAVTAPTVSRPIPARKARRVQVVRLAARRLAVGNSHATRDWWKGRVASGVSRPPRGHVLGDGEAGAAVAERRVAVVRAPAGAVANEPVQGLVVRVTLEPVASTGVNAAADSSPTSDGPDARRSSAAAPASAQRLHDAPPPRPTRASCQSAPRPSRHHSWARLHVAAQPRPSRYKTRPNRSPTCNVSGRQRPRAYERVIDAYSESVTRRNG
jgi:hypothetical protein